MTLPAIDPAQRDGNGGFRVGQSVVVRAEVRPRGFAGKRGTVAEVRRVVPRSVADALHGEGMMTNNGDYEIGLDFSAETVAENLRVSAWFLPRELSEAIQGLCVAPSSPPKARKALADPAAA